MCLEAWGEDKSVLLFTLDKLCSFFLFGLIKYHSKKLISLGSVPFQFCPLYIHKVVWNESY